MTEHLTTVACTDDPNIIQQPPPAPLDTLIGIGEGKSNNVPGYTVEFVLVDAGEPGVNDQMGIKIYETANPSNVVLDVPLQLLTNGSLQAHYDQPHKYRAARSLIEVAAPFTGCRLSFAPGEGAGAKEKPRHDAPGLVSTATAPKVRPRGASSGPACRGGAAVPAGPSSHRRHRRRHRRRSCAC